MVGRIQWRTRVQGEARLDAIARTCRVPDEILAPAFEQAARNGLAGFDGVRLTLTPAGQREADLIKAAWQRWVGSRIDDWDITDPSDRAALDRALESITTRLLQEDQSRPTHQPA